MRFRISRRGKQYSEVARTLLRAARALSDRAIEYQLRALADYYEQRAERAAHVDAARHLSRAPLN
jgi:hypothetical protein